MIDTIIIGYNNEIEKYLRLYACCQMNNAILLGKTGTDKVIIVKVGPLH